MKKKNYINITKEWLNNQGNETIVEESNYYESNGIKYYVDNKNVILAYSKHELEVAIWLANTFGYKVKLLPRINIPEGIKTADYLFKDELWDLKSINSNSKQALYHAIYKNKLQSRNFIIDISNSNMTIRDALLQLKKIYNRLDTNFVNKIMLKKNQKFIIYKKRI